MGSESINDFSAISSPGLSWIKGC